MAPQRMGKKSLQLLTAPLLLSILSKPCQLAARGMNIINLVLVLLNVWCNRNRLTINCKKTKYCIYGMKWILKQSSQQDMIISLSNTVLEKVCSYKYLGFILDDQLNFNKHVKEMIKLITHKLYLLSRIRRYLTKQASITIFNTMILSLIEYVDIIYAGTNQLNLDKIVNLFYRGLRTCVNSNYKLSKEALCENCHIAPLDIRRGIICYYSCTSKLI